MYLIILLLIVAIAQIVVIIHKRRVHRMYSGGNRRRTYLIASEVVPKNLVREFLPDWEETHSTKYADLVVGMGSSGRLNLDHMKARMKSRLDAAEMTDKVRLHRHLADSGLVARTFEVDAGSELPAGVWMVRANWGWHGSANRVVTTTAELQTAYAEFTGGRRGAAVIASEYIDPMLYKGRKFHFRAYIVVSVLESQRFATILSTMEIMTAGKPYIAAEWGDREIHDSHFNDELYALANDELPDLVPAASAVLRDAVRRLLPLLRKYPESPAAYDVIGADVMFRADGTPVIIELNKLPGFDFGSRTRERDIVVPEIITHIMEGPVRAEFSAGEPSSDLGEIVRSRTYIYLGDQLPAAEVAARLPGWTHLDIDAGRADLVLASGRGLDDKRLYAAEAFVKCHLDASDITNKRKLYEHIADYAPDLIPKSFIVRDDSAIEPGSTWIVRAAWGFGGRAVEIARSTAELQKWRKEFAGRKTDDTIASEYIVDPMLYRGRKFHLRIYMMLFVPPTGPKTLTMLRRGLLIPALKEYTAADWNNREIHDTHGKDNPLLGLFPEAYIEEFGEDPTAKIAESLRRAAGPLMELVKPYPESVGGFEMLGADIMFTAAGDLRIIEINDNPGLTWIASHPSGAETAEMMLDYIFSTIGQTFGLDVRPPPLIQLV